MLKRTVLYLCVLMTLVSCSTSKKSNKALKKSTYAVIKRTKGERAVGRRAIIKGFVLDKASNTLIPHAEVSLVGCEPRITTETNEQGAFVLLVPEGTWQLEVANLGNVPVQTKELSFAQQEELEMVFDLGTLYGQQESFGKKALKTSAMVAGAFVGSLAKAMFDDLLEKALGFPIEKDL